MDYREIIRQRRLQKGFSQDKLAKLVGISQPFINEIECGKKSPSLKVLMRICEELDIAMFHLPE